MGLATAGCFRRIFRLSWLGHQSRLPAPSVGWLRRPAETGQPPALSLFRSPMTASGLSDTGILPGLWWCSGTGRSRAAGAQAPIDDLGLVDREALVVGRGQAGRLADRTVDIGDGTARPAHDVMVVVPDPCLVASHGAGRLDATQQTHGGQRAQHVVNGLVGHLAEVVTHDPDDRV